MPGLSALKNLGKLSKIAKSKKKVKPRHAEIPPDVESINTLKAAVVGGGAHAFMFNEMANQRDKKKASKKVPKKSPNKKKKKKKRVSK